MIRPSHPAPLCRALLLAIVVMTALGVCARPAVAQGDAFVSDIEDLPLMPGLTEAADGGMVFDTAAGRIVEAYASGAVTRAQVVEFYAATLPQLGWTRSAETVFRREDETLVLEFPPPDPAARRRPVLTVRFSLSPSTADTRPK
jgi:hypothetical protein